MAKPTEGIRVDVPPYSSAGWTSPGLDPDGELANRLAALLAGGVASIRNVL